MVDMRLPPVLVLAEKVLDKADQLAIGKSGFWLGERAGWVELDKERQRRMIQLEALSGR